MNIKEKIKELEAQHGFKVFYCIQSGSKLYGTDSKNSDTDYIGLFVPNETSLLLKNDIEHYSSTTGQENSKNTKDDIDIQLWSIHKFCNLLEKGETGALDLLFSLQAKHLADIEEVHIKEYTDIIKEYHNNCFLISKNLKAFIGYCLTQAKKYNIKGSRFTELKVFMENFGFTDGKKCSEDVEDIKSIIQEHELKYVKLVLAPGPKRIGNTDIWYLEVLGRKHDLSIQQSELHERLIKAESSFGSRAQAAANGVDNKALSHALRVILECRELLESGSIQFPLKQAEWIKEIKYNLQPEGLEDLIGSIEYMLNTVYNLLDVSELPEKVSRDMLNCIILDVLNLDKEQE